MTSVLRIQFHSLGNKSKDGRRGIGAGALVALSRHNIREKIDYKCERFRGKAKNTKHIKPTLSKRNICYKQMDFNEIKKIKKQAKDTKAKSNGVGSFEMIFDFTAKVETFDAEAHKDLIIAYLQEQGITQRFELLEMVLHLDEEKEKPHFHLIFSGFDKTQGIERFAVNDFFSPKGEESVLKNKDGETIFKRIKNGKRRGEYELDENGAKIPRLEAYRRNGAQWLQDSYSNYLSINDYKYSNKKRWTSVLQFPQSIWRRFSQDTKDDVYYFRALEDLYHQEQEQGKGAKELEAIEKEMDIGVFKLLRIAREKEQEFQNERKNNNYMGIK